MTSGAVFMWIVAALFVLAAALLILAVVLDKVDDMRGKR